MRDERGSSSLSDIPTQAPSEVIHAVFGDDPGVTNHEFPDGAPLRLIAASWREDHWWVVGFGLTEIGAKESPNPDVSGWGFEFGIRVEGTADGVPGWAAQLIYLLAGHVWESREIFSPGDHMEIPPFGPWSAIYFTLDAERSDVIAGPNGAWVLLQIQMLDAWQYELVRRWNTLSFDAILRRYSPKRIVSRALHDELDRPEVRAELVTRSLAEGQATQVHQGEFSVTPGDVAADTAGAFVAGERLEHPLPRARIHLSGELLPHLRLSFELSLARGNAVYVRRADDLHLVFTTGEVEPIQPGNAIRVNLRRAEIADLVRKLSVDDGALRLSDGSVLSWGRPPGG